jgi:hypothetical protein
MPIRFHACSLLVNSTSRIEIYPCLFGLFAKPVLHRCQRCRDSMSFESWDDNEFPIFRVDNSKVGLCMVYVCRINLSLPEVGFMYRGAEYGTLLELFRITEF